MPQHQRHDSRGFNRSAASVRAEDSTLTSFIVGFMFGVVGLASALLLVGVI